MIGYDLLYYPDDFCALNPPPTGLLTLLSLLNDDFDLCNEGID